MILNNVFHSQAAIMMLHIVRAKFIDGDCAGEKKYGDYMYLQNKFATANEVFGWARNVFFFLSSFVGKLLVLYVQHNFVSIYLQLLVLYA